MPSPFLTPRAGPDGQTLNWPNFPALEAAAIVVEKTQRRRCTGCLDNLNDYKLSWLYFLLLLPFISVTVLSFFIPNLRGLTNYACTDEGPQRESSRIAWSAFGMMQLGGFVLGMYATRRVWDGFSIRRELAWAVGCQACLILITLLSIFTAHVMDADAPPALTRFDEFLSVSHELLLVLRSVLLFHVSLALPLVESYSLDALSVNRARLRLTGRPGAGGWELRDRSESVSQNLRLGTPARDARGRGDSAASDGSNLSAPSSAGNSHRASRARSAFRPTRPSFFLSPQQFRRAVASNGSTMLDPSVNLFPLSPSNLQDIAYGLAQGLMLPPQASHGIPITLGYIINHPDYFHHFVDFLCRDSQMELLWGFWVSIQLFQDLDADGNASAFEKKEMAQKIYMKFLGEDTLKGNTEFSQWLLCMANVLQHEWCVEHGTAVPLPDGVRGVSPFLLGERETIQALSRVDEEVQRIASLVFAEDEEELPRDLFEAFQHAAMEIFEAYYFPRFLKSRHYKRLMRDIAKSTIIQTRIERAHFL